MESGMTARDAQFIVSKANNNLYDIVALVSVQGAANSC